MTVRNMVAEELNATSVVLDDNKLITPVTKLLKHLLEHVSQAITRAVRGCLGPAYKPQWGSRSSKQGPTV